MSRMNNSYENFYQLNYYFQQSSQSQVNDFQAFQFDDSNPSVKQIGDSKSYQKTVVLNTHSTFSHRTSSQFLEHFTTNKIKESTEISRNVENFEQKTPKLAQDGKVHYNQIETSFFRLQKIVDSYSGFSKESMNLNKYYCSCIKDFLFSLRTSQIITVEEYAIYEQSLRKNQLLSLHFSKQAQQHIQNYLSSSHLVQKILESKKMNFPNKIIAIKYLQALKQKFKQGESRDNKWKRSRK